MAELPKILGARCDWAARHVYQPWLIYASPCSGFEREAHGDGG